MIFMTINKCVCVCVCACACVCLAVVIGVVQARNMNTENLIYVHPLADSEERNVIKGCRTVNIFSLLLFLMSVYCSKMRDYTG